jgi:hypothetical protein
MGMGKDETGKGFVVRSVSGRRPWAAFGNRCEPRPLKDQGFDSSDNYTTVVWSMEGSNAGETWKVLLASS